MADSLPFSPPTALSAPPNNLTQVNKTSSSVTITWGDVPCVEQNSVVVGYSFLYGPVTSGVRGTVATSVRAMTVTGLAPYTNYSIVMSAVNSDLYLSSLCGDRAKWKVSRGGILKLLCISHHLSTWSSEWTTSHQHYL